MNIRSTVRFENTRQAHIRSIHQDLGVLETIFSSPGRGFDARRNIDRFINVETSRPSISNRIFNLEKSIEVLAEHTNFGDISEIKENLFQLRWGVREAMQADDLEDILRFFANGAENLQKLMVALSIENEFPRNLHRGMTPNFKLKTKDVFMLLDEFLEKV
jgi:hypothetical protein